MKRFKMSEVSSIKRTLPYMHAITDSQSSTAFI